MSLDGFSLSPLIHELNTQLSGGRIDKIFQPNKHTFRLNIRQPGNTYNLVISINPEHYRIGMSDAHYENPDVPPPFCMLLRKHLESGRIASISQYKKDRVIQIAIDVVGEKGRIETKVLIVELMGKHSNLILVNEFCNDQPMIIEAARRIGMNQSRKRTILPNMAYVYPPDSDRVDLLTTPISISIELLKQHELPLVKALIKVFAGLGPLTANEIAFRANLPPDKPILSLQPLEWETLKVGLRSITNAMSLEFIKPTVAIYPNNGFAGIAAFSLYNLSQNHNCHLKQFSSMSEAVEFADPLKGIIYTTMEAALIKIVTLETARLEKKLVLLDNELVEAKDAEHYKIFADILMSYLYQVTKNLQEITLPNIYSLNPNDTVTIALKQGCSGIENVQNYYNKYNKLKRAQELILTQKNKCIEEIDYLQSISYSLETAESLEEWKEIQLELTAAGYIKQQVKKSKTITISNPQIFFTEDHFKILVGKNNRQNDHVTFKMASGNDLWFHTKNIPGSHVILKTENQLPSSQAILTAGKLAAYFSKARNSANVPVDYTQRRNVKKPNGSKPGFVIYTHQTTLSVNPEIINNT